MLWDSRAGTAHLHGIKTAAQSLALKLEVVEVTTTKDVDRAFLAFRGQPQALVILPSPMMYVESDRLAKLSTKYRMPAASMFRRFAVDSGGLLAYGADTALTNERCAVLVAKILNGAKPGDLPVERPSKFQLVVSLKGAKALGLTVPESVLYRADEVIR